MENVSENLFNTIVGTLRSNVSYDFLKKSKTQSGNTQLAERDIIRVVREILQMLELTFTEASSQQPYDFRIRLPGYETFQPTEEQIRNGDIFVEEQMAMLLLEVKKTDSNTIYFNDTCPNKLVNYLIIYTGKIFKTKPEILPAIYSINGSEIIATSPWLLDFKGDIDALREKYRETEGIMTVYPRPTYKANMETIFREKYDTSKIAKLDQLPV